MRMENVIDSHDLDRLREHFAEKVIVLGTGCFDILHLGHLHFLQEARQQGDILVVGVNSDDSIKKMKGTCRPVVGETERAALLAAFRCVDYVFIYDHVVVDDWMLALKPNVFAIGEESVSKCPSESATAEQVNARIHVIQRVPSASTTLIVSNIQQLPHG